MRREKDGPARVAEGPHGLLELVRRQRVQPDEGFIHQDQFGRMEQRRDDGQLLLHAVGVVPDGLGQRPGQAEALPVHPHPLGAGRVRHPEDVRDEIEVLDAGHVMVKVGVIGQIGQLPLGGKRVLPHRDAVHPHLAAVRLEDAAATFQGSGLARTVRPDEAEDLAGPDGQRQSVHCRLLPVALGQLLNLKHSASPFDPICKNHPTFGGRCQGFATQKEGQKL